MIIAGIQYDIFVRGILKVDFHSAPKWKRMTKNNEENT